jgi:hypothetical protein
MDDAEQEAGKHQAYRCFRVDAGSAVVGAVEFGDFGAQPTQIEDTVDAGEHMVIGDQVA